MMLATATGAADEAPAARARLDAVVAGLEAIERDLPRIAAAAEVAAQAYLDGADLATRGGALHLALAQQPGGLNDDYGLPGGDDAIVLLAGDDPAARRPAPRGRVVIAIGATPLPGAIWLDHHGDRRTAAALTAAVAWTLRCEMFAACVRRGRVPVLLQSALIDTRQRRYVRYRDQRFHHDVTLAPIAAGDLGRAYLRELRRVLGDVGTTSWPAVVAACRAARDARAGGGRAFVRFGPAYAAHHLDPKGPLQHLDADDRPGPDDTVIAFAGDESPRWLDWHERSRLLAAGRIAWVAPAFDLRPGDLPRRAIVLDTMAPFGDALVRVPGHDTRLAPATPVVTAAILALLEADLGSDELASPLASRRARHGPRLCGVGFHALP